MSIEVKGLSFSYRDEKTLKGIDFSAKDGEVTVIIGSNGAGKTTLLRCILGLLPWKEGTITVGGNDVKAMTRQESACAMAYVPQMCSPSFNFPCLDMVMMGANNRTGLFETPKKEEEAYALACMEKLHVLQLKDRPFFETSGGERQLILIARALMQKASVLLLDEPVANLDYGNQIRVMEDISSLAREGYCVVLTSHNPEQTYLYADRVAAFQHGKMLLEGSPQEVVNEQTICQLYGIDIHMESILGDKMRVFVPEMKKEKERK